MAACRAGTISQESDALYGGFFYNNCPLVSDRKPNPATSPFSILEEAFDLRPKTLPSSQHWNSPRVQRPPTVRVVFGYGGLVAAALFKEFRCGPSNVVAESFSFPHKLSLHRPLPTSHYFIIYVYICICIYIHIYTYNGMLLIQRDANFLSMISMQRDIPHRDTPSTFLFFQFQIFRFHSM